ncbi:hypothetical protein N6H18_09845 [Reichenbachiella agarivorans]|uniref:Addiction module component n=1 Tax=Reichenbachiella agarivorans TaxID=2979464 RepID=A0ABY6CJF5_9BACT|nr:hypothetical protein [Reichenbachiella agarivorans]UXP30656.1 hypothetical protein N6H18_09845 [Reichenbachiella agarivorans]
MNVETLKLGLIERLMRMHNTSTLQRMDQLLTQVEMETRAEESRQAISEGDVMSIEEFRQENLKWAKDNYTK